MLINYEQEKSPEISFESPCKFFVSNDEKSALSYSEFWKGVRGKPFFARKRFSLGNWQVRIDFLGIGQKLLANAGKNR